MDHGEDDKQKCSLIISPSFIAIVWRMEAGVKSVQLIPKIIALTTQVNNFKAQLLGAPAGKTSSKAPSQVAKLAGKRDKESDNKWRYTKVGATTKDLVRGAIVKWCPHHGTGAYMLSVHNHADWLEKKKRQ
jgi:hypothetical protein